jgi:GNAT superfamily N-acetyltransferase
MAYLTLQLNSSHKKNNFNCGKDLLDNYLHRQAKQDVKRKLTVCFILANEDNVVQGYYTLSNAGIPLDELPEDLRKKYPKSYRNLPATLLGRLAVDQSFKGRGLGALLLMDALKRSFEISTTNIGSMAVLVDPLDDDSVRFYEKFGFIALPDSGKMFLPMATISEIFNQ